MSNITADQLVEATGATHRQIDYWATHEVVPVCGEKSPGSGFRRTFDEEIIPRVKILVKASAAFGGGLNADIMKKIYDGYEEGKVRIGFDIYLVWT
jgi:hypothetical protein